MKIISLILAAFFVIMPAPQAHETGCLSYCMEACGEPEYGEEWFVIALCTNGYNPGEDFKESYIASVAAKAAETDGVLTSTRFTEYSRCVIALTLCGADARDIGGYDLTLPLLDMDNVLKQGLNGAIFALIALDSGGYAPAMSKVLVETILSRQLEDGGWALGGKISDSDLTAMAIQALSEHRDDEAVNAAIEKGLARLSAMQQDDGSFTNYGDPNSESCAQVIIALSSLGLEPGYMTKNGNTVFDALLSYRNEDGGFCHMADGASANMPTVQAMIAFNSMKRLNDCIYMPEAPEVPEVPEVPDEPMSDMRSLSDSRPADLVVLSPGESSGRAAFSMSGAAAK